ncbi:MAG: L,D-transpeptidase [Xanthobacteraceae bacterium]
MTRIAFFAAAFGLGACLALHPASAEIVAQVDISQQTMTVTVDGTPTYVWPVSTARRGYVTPRGAFKVQGMHRMHYSSLFNNAPMPYSIFFHGHYAIHGTTEVKRLGRPASAGCIRLHPDNARLLFDLVKEHGAAELRVIVEG